MTTSPCDEFTGSLPFHIFVVGVDADFKFRRHTQVDSSMTIIPERGVVRSRETFKFRHAPTISLKQLKLE